LNAVSVNIEGDGGEIQFKIRRRKKTSDFAFYIEEVVASKGCLPIYKPLSLATIS
jgi:hypothetical protein